MTSRHAALAGALLLTACSSPPAAPTASDAPVPSGPALDCAAPIDSLGAPPAGYSALLEAVALRTEGVLETHDGFAKTGLLIRTGQAAEILVPPGRAEVEWGNTGAGPRTSHLWIPPCPRSGAGEWQVYPGGYHVTTPTCLPVEIRAAGRTTTVHIAVGAACPP